MSASRLSTKFCTGFLHGSAFGSAAGLALVSWLGFTIHWPSWLLLAVAVGMSLYARLFWEERWKDASYITRLVRYTVFRPLRFIQFCWWILCWLVYGAKPLEYPPVVEEEWPGIKFTRPETIKHFWTISVSMSQYDCQNFLTIQECRDELKAAYAISQKTTD